MDGQVMGHLVDRVEGLISERRSGQLNVRADGPSTVVVGIAGSVAVGKSFLASSLERELVARRPSLETAVIASDSFLFPNHELERLQITMRKGFPESFDYRAMVDSVAALKDGRSVRIPEYSHSRYDIVEGSYNVLEGLDVAIVEGVNVLQDPPSGDVLSENAVPVGPARLADLLDIGIYLDADRADIKSWFIERFISLCSQESEATGGDGPNGDGGFYAGFVGMDDYAIRSIAEWTWNEINEPNLRDYIEPTRANADVIVVKGSDHRILTVGEAP